MGATGQSTVLSVTHNAGATLNCVQLFKHVIMSLHGKLAHVHMQSYRFKQQLICQTTSYK